MTKRRDYIPSKLNDFAAYHAYVCKVVSKHHKQWGIPKAVVKEFEERRDVYDAAYKAILNDMTRTRIDTFNHDRIRKEYTRFIRTVVQQYLAHNPAVSAGHKGTMGLVVELVRRRQLREVTEEADCYPQAIGGLSVRFNCRVPGTGGRPKLHSECHMVEVEYMLLDEALIIDHLDFVPTGRFTSSKAQFTVKVGRPGQWLYARARWVNNSDPGRSGGWGPIRMVMIH